MKRKGSSRDVVEILLEIVGMMLIITGITLVCIPAALIVAGIFTLVIAWRMTNEPDIPHE